MSNGWRWFWRVIGVLALTSSSICAFFLWALWRATDLKPVAAGGRVELDSLSLQLDILALTLTAVGIALGVIGLFGYQNIRDVAVARAAEEARLTAQKYLNVDQSGPPTYYQEKMGNPESDTAAKGVASIPSSRFDLANVPTSDAVKEKRSNDERDRGDAGDRASSDTRSSRSDDSAGR